jgi:hypothetical protein
MLWSHRSQTVAGFSQLHASSSYLIPKPSTNKIRGRRNTNYVPPATLLYGAVALPCRFRAVRAAFDRKHRFRCHLLRCMLLYLRLHADSSFT